MRERGVFKVTKRKANSTSSPPGIRQDQSNARGTNNENVTGCVRHLGPDRGMATRGKHLTFFDFP